MVNSIQHQLHVAILSTNPEPRAARAMTRGIIVAQTIIIGLGGKENLGIEGRVLDILACSFCQQFNKFFFLETSGVTGQDIEAGAVCSRSKNIAGIAGPLAYLLGDGLPLGGHGPFGGLVLGTLAIANHCLGLPIGIRRPLEHGIYAGKQRPEFLGKRTANRPLVPELVRQPGQ